MTAGSETAAFSAFATAALTIALIMTLLIIAIGSAQIAVVRSLKDSTQSVKRWGDAILIVVGVWLIILALWANTFAQIFTV